MFRFISVLMEFLMVFMYESRTIRPAKVTIAVTSSDPSVAGELCIVTFPPFFSLSPPHTLSFPSLLLQKSLISTEELLRYCNRCHCGQSKHQVPSIRAPHFRIPDQIPFSGSTAALLCQSTYPCHSIQLSRPQRKQACFVLGSV